MENNLEKKTFKRLFRSLWVYLFVVALIISVGYISAILVESNRLRKFRVDAFVLCNESSICVADGIDGTVRVSRDNLQALYSLIEKTRGSVTIGRPYAQDTTSFDFDCHDIKWNLVVEKINGKKLRISLTGERDYVLYVKNDNLYESFVKIASVDSFNGKNKKIG